MSYPSENNYSVSNFAYFLICEEANSRLMSNCKKAEPNLYYKTPQNVTLSMGKSLLHPNKARKNHS